VPPVAAYALLAAAPLFAMVLLIVYHRARSTPGGLDRQVWGAYVVVQLLLVGLIGWSLHLRAFDEEVSGKVLGGRDVLGRSATTTELWVSADGGASRKFHFASRVPDSCRSGMVVHKPAYSTVWTCSSEEARVVVDSDAKDLLVVAAGIGAAFLLFVGRR
jgi:hypothetical protein